MWNTKILVKNARPMAAILSKHIEFTDGGISLDLLSRLEAVFALNPIEGSPVRERIIRVCMRLDRIYYNRATKHEAGLLVRVQHELRQTVVADVPVADVPVADVPVADVPVADVPVVVAAPEPEKTYTLADGAVICQRLLDNRIKSTLRMIADGKEAVESATDETRAMMQDNLDFSQEMLDRLMRLANTGVDAWVETGESTDTDAPAADEPVAVPQVTFTASEMLAARDAAYQTGKRAAYVEIRGWVHAHATWEASFKAATGELRTFLAGR